MGNNIRCFQIQISALRDNILQFFVNLFGKPFLHGGIIEDIFTKNF